MSELLNVDYRDTVFDPRRSAEDQGVSAEALAFDIEPLQVSLQRQLGAHVLELAKADTSQVKSNYDLAA